MSRLISECGQNLRQGIMLGFGQGVLGVVIAPQSTRPPQRIFLEPRLYGYRSNGVPVYEGVPRDGAETRKERFILPSSHHPPEMRPELT